MAEGWTILKQQQTIGRQPDESFGPVVRITYQTAGGTVRVLDVPVDLYSADNVRAMLDAAAKETDEITNL